jgi:transcriptional regulator NrdR family protein
MVCLHCGGSTRVTNSRSLKRPNQVWRRRQCDLCGSIFTTHEVAQYSAEWLVQDSDRQLKPFSRDQLLLSIHKSCEHRPSALHDASSLTDTVINKLTPLVNDGQLLASTITHTVQVALNRFDPAASVHYHAFHHK